MSARKPCLNVDLEEMALITETIDSQTYVLRVKDPELAGRIHAQSAKLRGLITRLDGYLKGVHARKRSTQERARDAQSHR